jgi:TPR repeat protein
MERAVRGPLTKVPKSHNQNPKPLTNNRSEAMRLLRLAVAQGHADAHIVLTDLLSDNFYYCILKQCDDESATACCEDRDDDEAIRLLQLALEQGTAQRHLDGMHSIAELYVPRAFTPRIFVTFCRYYRRGDHAEAFKHYKLASDAGSSASRVALAGMYQRGEGVAQDVSEALKLLILDAEESCEANIWFAEDSLKRVRDFYLESGDCAEAIKWCVIFISLLLHFVDKTTGASAALTEGTWTSCSTWRACMRCCVIAELRFSNSRLACMRGGTQGMRGMSLLKMAA